MKREMNLELGYYWVNAFDTWIIAEFTDRFEWFTCGNEEDINNEIKDIGNYIGSDGEMPQQSESLSLLKVAKCPNSNCDNNGTISTWYEYDNEWEPEPCQCCYEKKKLLNNEG